MGEGHQPTAAVTPTRTDTAPERLETLRRLPGAVPAFTDARRSACSHTEPSGRSPATSPRGHTLPWTRRPPGASPAAASPPAQSRPVSRPVWTVVTPAYRSLSPRDGGAASSPGHTANAPLSGARSAAPAPSVRKAFAPRVSAQHPGPPPPCFFRRAVPPGPPLSRRLSPPLLSSVSPSVSRLLSGSRRPGFLPPSALTPAPAPAASTPHLPVVLSPMSAVTAAYPDTSTGSLCRAVFLASF